MPLFQIKLFPEYVVHDMCETQFFSSWLAEWGKKHQINSETTISPLKIHYYTQELNEWPRVDTFAV